MLKLERKDYKREPIYPMLSHGINMVWKMLKKRAKEKDEKVSVDKILGPRIWKGWICSLEGATWEMKALREHVTKKIRGTYKADSKRGLVFPLSEVLYFLLFVIYHLPRKVQGVN